jgi:hypothetical protein
MALFISGCETPYAYTDPAGRLEVLGPGRGFSLDPLPEDWTLEDSWGFSEEQLVLTNFDGVSSLRVTSGEDRFAMVRHVWASLVISPYLSWRWNVSHTTKGSHPVRLIVGFYSDDQGGERWRPIETPAEGDGLPDQNRAVAIIWANSALQRGNTVKIRSEDHPTGRFTVRGGQENAGVWRTEVIDLLRIYKRLWPKDDASRVQVVLIGVAAAKSRRPATTHISDVVLSR